MFVLAVVKKILIQKLRFLSYLIGICLFKKKSKQCLPWSISYSCLKPLELEEMMQTTRTPGYLSSATVWQGLCPHQAMPVVGPQSVSGCLKSLSSCASSQLPSTKVWVKRSLRREERSGTRYTGWMWINTTKLSLGSRGLNLALPGEDGETVILYNSFNLAWGDGEGSACWRWGWANHLLLPRAVMRSLSNSSLKDLLSFKKRNNKSKAPRWDSRY